MLDKARQRLARLPAEAQRRVTLVQADGENADEAVGGQRFAAVLCHGVLGYLEQPEPLVSQLCRCAAAGGIVSIMTGNAKAMAVRPALERRWDDALASFDARTEIGVLGVPGRADTVEELSELMRRRRRGAGALVRGVAVRRLARVQRGRARPGRRQSRWRRRPRSNSKPAGGTPTASSAASSTSWDAKARADGGGPTTATARSASSRRGHSAGFARRASGPTWPRIRDHDRTCRRVLWKAATRQRLPFLTSTKVCTDWWSGPVALWPASVTTPEMTMIATSGRTNRSDSGGADSASSSTRTIREPAKGPSKSRR